MNFNEIVAESGMTKYKIAKKGNIPYATFSDLCSGKTQMKKCSAETLYKLSKILNVSMETLYECGLAEQNDRKRERSYEYGLPEYLQHDLDAYKSALKNGSSLLDCLWGELYGSINIAEINDGLITPEHAEYLRKKYLF